MSQVWEGWVELFVSEMVQITYLPNKVKGYPLVRGKGTQVSDSNHSFPGTTPYGSCLLVILTLLLQVLSVVRLRPENRTRLSSHEGILPCRTVPNRLDFTLLLSWSWPLLESWVHPFSLLYTYSSDRTPLSWV